ncbi:unnamed protein product [Caenorhabditis nigoni]
MANRNELIDAIRIDFYAAQRLNARRGENQVRGREPRTEQQNRLVTDSDRVRVPRELSPIEQNRAAEQIEPSRPSPPIRQLVPLDCFGPISCVYCSRWTHLSDQCSYISDVSERKEHLEWKRLCTRCLGDHHIVRCPRITRETCHYCNDQDADDLHHSSLCPTAVNREAQR